jgi:hypothetical protein
MDVRTATGAPAATRTRDDRQLAAGRDVGASGLVTW